MPKNTKAEDNEAPADADAKPPRRARSTSSRKKTRTTSAPPRKTKIAAAPAAEPTEEEIRLRAYFIAERRQRLDLPGAADSDWLEAKSQLLSEAAPR